MYVRFLDQDGQNEKRQELEANNFWDTFRSDTLKNVSIPVERMRMVVWGSIVSAFNKRLEGHRPLKKDLER